MIDLIDDYGVIHLTATGTVVAHSGAGLLTTVNINTVSAAGGTLTIEDGGSGIVLAVIDLTTLASKFFAVPYTRNLTLVTGTAAGDVTVGFIRDRQFPEETE